MTNYKLIACDLDGTLMSTDLSLSDKNSEAIKKLSQAGIHFVPCTGRTLSEMSDTVNNPDIRYYIYSNGAGIWDKRTGERILTCLSDSAAGLVLDLLSSMDTYVVIHHDGKTYADARTAYKGRQEYNVSFNVDELIRDFSDIREDFFPLACSMKDIESITVFFRNADDADKCRSILEKCDELLIVKGWEYNFEIFSHRASKGRALEMLAEKLGVALSDTIAIGDSGNDISMIKTAGLGLATSNACDSLKEIADEVICSNDENVAEYVLNNCFKL